MRRLLSAACGLLALVVGCEEPTAPDDAMVPDAGPITARVTYTQASSDIYAAPWPDERLRAEDGRIAIDAFPNPRSLSIVDQLKSLVATADGFPISATIYIGFTGALDERSLPSLRESLTAEASVFVMDVDPASPELGARAPVDVRFLERGGPLGTDNLLAILPLQGRPLAPSRLYAAVVTRAVQTRDGERVDVGTDTRRVYVNAERVEGLSEPAFLAHRTAAEALETQGIDLGEIAATAVFRTWDPTAALRDAVAQVRAGPPPRLEGNFTLRETYDDYCVYHAVAEVPDFQGGEPPYASEGGAWTYDRGALVIQRRARANVWVTLPRIAVPNDGLPIVTFIRTGGGGDRPLVDRGQHDVDGRYAPGSGPAQAFAQAGYAGISVDGPLGGLRNLNDWDEQFSIFNIANPAGLRDNIRQSALEITEIARFVDTIEIDPSDCNGLSSSGPVHFDPTHLALMGHSMGATIAPLAAALEPRFGSLVLSGAGASWIRNVIFKESPIVVRPAAENLLGYTGRFALHEHDPALALLQWAGEPADPQSYAHLVSESQSVLMFQGILDTYIPPPIANAMSLAFGLDLAGESLDEELRARFAPLSETLDLAGGQSLALPAFANRGAALAVVVQHLEDGIEDGHEIVFQRADARLQYRCMLEGAAEGQPMVVSRTATSCAR